MPLDQTANFKRIDVSGTHTNSDTTIQLEAGEASKLPDPANGEYNLVWWNITDSKLPSDDSNVEIVRVTGRNTTNDTITVQRGQEGTSAVAHDSNGDNYKMILSATSKMFEDIDSGNFSTNSVTVTAGDGLKNGGAVALGDSTTLDVEPADFAGNALEDDGADNLAVSTDGVGTDELDESAAYSFTNLGATTISGGNLDMNDNKIVSTRSGTTPGLIDLDAGSSNYAVVLDQVSDEMNQVFWQTDPNKGKAIQVRDQTDSETLFEVTIDGKVNIPNGNLDMNDNVIADPSNNTTADSMTANPETDSEDGYIEVEIDGTTRQIPFYNQ